MQRHYIRLFIPALILLVVLSAAFLLFNEKLESYGIDTELLLWGNLFIFIITLFSFLMMGRGLSAKNAHAFFRLVYGSFMLKLFTLAGAAFAYIMMMKKEVNKPGLFICMGLYLVYTFIEVSALLKISKKKASG